MSEFTKPNRIVEILLAERTRTLSAKEKSILAEWESECDKNKAFRQSLNDDSNIPLKIKQFAKFKSDLAFNEFTRQTKKDKRRIVTFKVLKYAAVVVPLLFAVWLFYPEKPNNELFVAGSEIQPGTSKAILKLDDGRVLNLEELEEQISNYEGTTISNNKKKVVYTSSDRKPKKRKLKYNTIEIPRGGEYQLVLSDGTKVWLNSESKIRYPVYFAENSRDVYLEGEAFFEVTENKTSPFVVHTPEQDVNVLGTSFNVRAYKDEMQTSTTLVSGKVRIYQTESEKEYTLMPNQQAVTSKQATVINEVNVNPFISWKNGRILFENNTLDEIFSDLTRWYNFEVVFSNEVLKNLRFSIDVERYENFGDILEILELTQKVSFEINENTVSIKEKE